LLKARFDHSLGPRSGLSTALIIGIVIGTVVVIVILVRIAVYLMRNGENESETCDDVANLGGEEKIANEPVLLDEEGPEIDDPPIDVRGFSLCMGTFSGLDDGTDQLFV
jgi:hypothetical protein